ncbi:hypothetical protein ASE61_15585 [Bosea sp. Root670]|nr:hypothetical protein ASE61_15585 [Bosea sp. Root670]
MSFTNDALPIIAASNAILRLTVDASRQDRYDLINSNGVLIVKAERQADLLPNLIVMRHQSFLDADYADSKEPA